MNFGVINFWVGRVMARGNKFITPLTYVMVLYQTSQQQPLFLLTLPLCLVGVVVWVIADHHKILEEELDYSYRRIPFLREISEDVKETNRLLAGTTGTKCSSCTKCSRAK